MKQTFFEDIEDGTDLPSLTMGPLTTAHLMRWSAAVENWHKIHYDQKFAVEHDGLPALLINGSFKQQFIMQLLRRLAGPGGWIWKVRFQFRGMDVVGDTLFTWGQVVSKQRAPEFGLVEIELGIVNGEKKESTPGSATVALPFRDGPPVRYPFVPPKL